MIKRLAPSITISDNPSEVFCVKFSPDGKLLAAGCGDGTVKVFNTQTGRLTYSLNTSSGKSNNMNLPVTSIRFRPFTSASKTKNVLLVVNAEGSTQHWHVTSGKCLNTINDEGNHLYAADYRLDGSMFATAGKDYSVRVYDEATKTLVTKLSGSEGISTVGHSNRVFTVKFVPDDPNVLLTGGWDNTIQMWDLRVKSSVRSIYGPHICGDALDINGDQILTGSWRPENPLEIWDYNTGKLMETIPWHQSNANGEACMLYCAQFSKGNGSMIAAGGSGANEAKVFDRVRGNKLIGTVAGLSRGVFTLDFNFDNSKIAVGGGDAALRIIDIYDATNSEMPLNRPTTPSISNAST